MQSLGRGHICLQEVSTAGGYFDFLPPLEGGVEALAGGFLVGAGGGLATGLVGTGAGRAGTGAGRGVGVSSATVDEADEGAEACLTM